jgi:hypothetical protein
VNNLAFSPIIWIPTAAVGMLIIGLSIKPDASIPSNPMSDHRGYQSASDYSQPQAIQSAANESAANEAATQQSMPPSEGESDQVTVEKSSPRTSVQGNRILAPVEHAAPHDTAFQSQVMRDQPKVQSTCQDGTPGIGRVKDFVRTLERDLAQSNELYGTSDNDSSQALRDQIRVALSRADQNDCWVRNYRR